MLSLEAAVYLRRPGCEGEIACEKPLLFKSLDGRKGTFISRYWMGALRRGPQPPPLPRDLTRSRSSFRSSSFDRILSMAVHPLRFQRFPCAGAQDDISAHCPETSATKAEVAGIGFYLTRTAWRAGCQCTIDLYTVWMLLGSAHGLSLGDIQTWALRPLAWRSKVPL
jgi:hypothetical protein